MAPHNITLYMDIEKICPFANRVLVTLDELKVPFKQVNLSLFNKPTWYTEMYKEGKLPLMDVDGVKVPESMVIVEMLNDLYDGKLYPEDPIKRAQINAMIVIATQKIIYTRWLKAVEDESKKAEVRADIEAGFEWLNEQLLEQSMTGPYFLGETYSVADIAVSPLVGRALYLLKYTLDGHEPAIVKQSERLRVYIDAIMSRPSFKASLINDDEYVAFMTQAFGEKFTKNLSNISNWK